MRQRSVIIVAVACIALLAIIGGSLLVRIGKKADNQMQSNRSPATASSDAKVADAVPTTNVTIASYVFSPATIKVKVGDTVTWTNQDSVRHTVTADNITGASPNSPFFGKGETYSFTFTRAGTYNYFCQPHPYMKAVVIVQ